MNHLAEIIIDRGIPRSDLKIAVHDYKIFPFRESSPIIQPDYWCRKHIIEKPENDIWIHYMSHELVGLNRAELEKYYYAVDPELKSALVPEMFAE
jgi:hypoxanthine phosphoribosyltransferase